MELKEFQCALTGGTDGISFPARTLSLTVPTLFSSLLTQHHLSAEQRTYINKLWQPFYKSSYLHIHSRTVITTPTEYPQIIAPHAKRGVTIPLCGPAAATCFRTSKVRTRTDLNENTTTSEQHLRLPPGETPEFLIVEFSTKVGQNTDCDLSLF